MMIRRNFSLLFFGYLQVILNDDDRNVTLQEFSSGIDFPQDAQLEGFELEFRSRFRPKTSQRLLFSSSYHIKKKNTSFYKFASSW